MPVGKFNILKVQRSPSGNELVSLYNPVLLFPELISATEASPSSIPWNQHSLQCPLGNAVWYNSHKALTIPSIHCPRSCLYTFAYSVPSSWNGFSPPSGWTVTHPSKNSSNVTLFMRSSGLLRLSLLSAFIALRLQLQNLYFSLFLIYLCLSLPLLLLPYE